MQTVPHVGAFVTNSATTLQKTGVVRTSGFADAVSWIDCESPEADGLERHSTAVAVARGMRAAGVTRSEANELLDRWNTAWCTPKLAVQDVLAAVDVAYSEEATSTAAPVAQFVTNSPKTVSAPAISKLAAALEAVRRGFAVFPLRPNGKIPAIKNWRNLATTDEAQVRQWWSVNPDYNIGGTTDDKFVADVDPRNGGNETLDAALLTEEFPKTARTQTAGGGAHIIYRLPDHMIVKGGAHKLGKGFDVKSWGGLIVLPGSTINDKPYAWMNDRPLGLVPEWMLIRCKQAKAKTAASGKRLIEEDDKAVEAAEQWLAYDAPDVFEGNRDNTGYVVACKLFEFGVSRDTCEAMLSEWNYTHCFPPMSDADVHRIAGSADRGMENAKGVAHPEYSPFEPVTIAERAVAAVPQSPEPAAKFRSIIAADGAERVLAARGKYLIKGLLDCEGMSVLYGESGGGKSFVSLDLAFCVAKGVDWYGRKVRAGAVVYLAAEGGPGIYARLAALKLRYGSLDGVHLHVIPVSADFVHGKADVDALIAEVRRIEQTGGQKVQLIVVDTLSRAMAGGDENSSVDMGAMVKALDYLRVVTRTHVLTVHHTGKDKAKGARGHSLLRAATDTEIEIDNRTLTVTKQRDMDGELTMGFRLNPLRIGVDEDGDPITSCYVEMLAELDFPGDPVPLDEELRAIKAAILKALASKYDKNPELIYSQPFTRAFAISCVVQMNAEHARVHRENQRAMNTKVDRWMHSLHAKAHLRKGKKGQWFMVDAQNAHNAQVLKVA